MYIKLQKEKMLLLFLMLFFLNAIKFFYFGFDIDTRISFALIIVVVMFSLYTYQARLKVPTFIKYYAIVTALSVTIISMYTKFHYGMRWYSAFRSGHTYWLILLVIPMSLLLQDKAKWNYILEIVNYISILWYIVMIIQFVLFTFAGKVIIPAYYGEKIWLRNGHIRIGLQPYGLYMIIYNFYMFIVNGKKKAIIPTVLGLVCLFFIDQTRVSQAIAVVAILICWVVSREQVSNRMIMLVIIAIAAALAFSLGLDEAIIESFSTSGEKAGSTLARLYALVYYWECFIKNPLCGFGFTSNPDIVNGPLGVAWPSDVGIVGQLAKLGLFIVPIYIFIIIYFIKICMDKNMNKSNKIFVILSLLFIIFSSGSLMILDAERSILTPIIVSTLNYLYMNSGKIDEPSEVASNNG